MTQQITDERLKAIESYFKSYDRYHLNCVMWSEWEAIIDRLRAAEHERDVALRALDDSVDQINRFRSTLFLVPSDTANSYIADVRAQIAAEKEAKG